MASTRHCPRPPTLIARRSPLRTQGVGLRRGDVQRLGDIGKGEEPHPSIPHNVRKGKADFLGTNVALTMVIGRVGHSWEDVLLSPDG